MLIYLPIEQQYLKMSTHYYFFLSRIILLNCDVDAIVVDYKMLKMRKMFLAYMSTLAIG